MGGEWNAGNRVGCAERSRRYPDTMQAVVSTAPHLARPGRPTVVARTLAELAGPTRGVVELPVRLMWNADRTFDLGDPDQLLWMYENVLRETTRAEDLRHLINGRTLRRVWRRLNLPRGVRQAWESRHRGLRTA
ncbi:hypothetical protein M2302_005690 [Micromonospora sp. A200]|nr:hypothetical protein [Micromonospora sp. A200]